MRVTQAFKIINPLTLNNMTSKFIIDIIDLCKEDNLKKEEYKEQYEKYYKPCGYMYDEETGQLYITTDKDFIIQENDKVYMPCLGVYIITHKQFDVSSANMEYFVQYV